MTMDDLQIDGIRQDVMESLKSALVYLFVFDTRCFRWKILIMSGPKVRLLLQLLIPLVVVVRPLQPSSSANPGFPGPESSAPVLS